MFSHALLRLPGENLASGLTDANEGTPDVAIALAQHQSYCEALADCGLSLTVLPALLAVLGKRAARREERRGARASKPVRETGRMTGAVLGLTGRRPALTLAVATALMLALAAPLLGLKLTDVGRETYSRDLPAVAAFHRVNDAFPELRSTHQVVVRADPARAHAVLGWQPHVDLHSGMRAHMQTLAAALPVHGQAA